MTDKGFFIAAIAGLTMGLIIGCQSDLTYHRKVTGKVESMGQRYQRSKSGWQEKIALQLSHYEADNVVKQNAGGADDLSVECVSTRCAALKEGQRVELSCAMDHRWMEPSVIACKMERTIECK